MFLKLKTKLYFFTAKRKSIVIMFIIILAINAIVIFSFMSKNKTVIQPTQPTIDVVAKEDDIGFEESKDMIYGKDIKNKYDEVKGTDYTILVATLDLLKGIDTNESKEHYRYILENDTNMISEIKDVDDNYMDAVFVNYNRLLKDIVVTKDRDGGYIAPYGFTDKEETEFNEYSERKSVVINDNAVFSEYPIYDGNYTKIGIMYIEDFNY